MFRKRQRDASQKLSVKLTWTFSLNQLKWSIWKKHQFENIILVGFEIEIKFGKGDNTYKNYYFIHESKRIMERTWHNTQLHKLPIAKKFILNIFFIQHVWTSIWNPSYQCNFHKEENGSFHKHCMTTQS